MEEPKPKPEYIQRPEGYSPEMWSDIVSRMLLSTVQNAYEAAYEETTGDKLGATYNLAQYSGTDLEMVATVICRDNGTMGLTSYLVAYANSYNEKDEFELKYLIDFTEGEQTQIPLTPERRVVRLHDES